VEESVAGIDFWMEPEDVVAASLKALERGEVVCVPGIINKVIKNVAPMLPRRPYYQLAEKMAAKFRNEADSDRTPDAPEVPS
jgi:short-subunit dehydrogenase